MSPYADADFTYEDFLPEDVVAAFKYAVVFQQEYARFVRDLAIELVGDPAYLGDGPWGA